MINGKIKSCGCLLKDVITKHGKNNTRLYKCWCHIKARCYNVTNNHYQYYGGRGIAMCNEWRDDFMSFYNWSMANGYNDTLTIDRIDVNGNYEPNNCRWVTTKQQNRNTRRNRYFTINGVTKCIGEWCEIYNINYDTVWSRLRRGWNITRALELEGVK